MTIKHLDVLAKVAALLSIGAGLVGAVADYGLREKTKEQLLLTESTTENNETSEED